MNYKYRTCTVLLIIVALFYVYYNYKKEYFTAYNEKTDHDKYMRSSLDIYYRDEDNLTCKSNSDCKDGCGKCDGTCQNCIGDGICNNQDSRVLSCTKDLSYYDGKTRPMKCDHLFNKKIYIYANNKEPFKYLNFESLETKTNVFIKKKYVKPINVYGVNYVTDPVIWTLERVYPSTGTCEVYIRTYCDPDDASTPIYYLSSNKYGDVTTSFFKGSYDQRWIIHDSGNVNKLGHKLFNIQSAVYNTYLAFLNSGNIDKHVGNVFTTCKLSPNTNWAIHSIAEFCDSTINNSACNRRIDYWTNSPNWEILQEDNPVIEETSDIQQYLYCCEKDNSTCPCYNKFGTKKNGGCDNIKCPLSSDIIEEKYEYENTDEIVAANEPFLSGNIIEKFDDNYCSQYTGYKKYKKDGDIDKCCNNNACSKACYIGDIELKNSQGLNRCSITEQDIIWNGYWTYNKNLEHQKENTLYENKLNFEINKNNFIKIDMIGGRGTMKIDNEIWDVMSYSDSDNKKNTIIGYLGNNRDNTLLAEIVEWEGNLKNHYPYPETYMRIVIIDDQKKAKSLCADEQTDSNFSVLCKKIKNKSVDNKYALVDDDYHQILGIRRTNTTNNINLPDVV